MQVGEEHTDVKNYRSCGKTVFNSD